VKQIRCCKGCTERHRGCHSTCEKYKAEKDDVSAYNKSEAALYGYYRAKHSKFKHTESRKAKVKK
jgi:hypothetical protein